jgi:hypothetical protein
VSETAFCGAADVMDCIATSIGSNSMLKPCRRSVTCLAPFVDAEVKANVTHRL